MPALMAGKHSGAHARPCAHLPSARTATCPPAAPPPTRWLWNIARSFNNLKYLPYGSMRMANLVTRMQVRLEMFVAGHTLGATCRLSQAWGGLLVQPATHRFFETYLQLPCVHWRRSACVAWASPFSSCASWYTPLVSGHGVVMHTGRAVVTECLRVWPWWLALLYWRACA